VNLDRIDDPLTRLELELMAERYEREAQRRARRAKALERPEARAEWDRMIGREEKR
jgi:hypothetical protein